MKRLAAAIIFFTRLPLWRVCNLDKKYYERVVPLWPLVGWITGGTMLMVYWLASQVLPVGISVVLALVSRVLLTGALHEDGFADFCDGFGGGTSRERTLMIMKDSHIGTYGVLGLIVYYLLLWQTLTALLGMGVTPWLLLVVDAFAKYLASTIIYFLPYARREEEAKAKVIYTQTPVAEMVMSAVWGLLPLTLFIYISLSDLDVVGTVLVLTLTPHLWVLLIPIMLPVLLCAYLFYMMKRHINGYTGDCCGATFILAELASHIGLLMALSV